MASDFADAAKALLSATTNFRSPYTRDSSIQLVNECFEWVEAFGDTNPARVEHRRLTERISTLNEERSALAAKRDALQQEKVSLKDEQQQIGAQQAEYRRMADSKLFSEEELRYPFQTGQKAIADYSSAETTSRIVAMSFCEPRS